MVRAPAFSNKSSSQSGQQSRRYRESERILTVSGAVSYSVEHSVAVNPGLPASFPWLSGHAQLYEKFKVHRLIFRYKNLKGTSSAGNILMSFDYDTLDSAPASAVEQTQSTVWVDGAPWRIFEMRVPPDNLARFTRAGSVMGDLKTYDFGRLYIAAEGCADTSDHGYLEVEYDIELFQKQSAASNLPTNNSVAEFTLGTSQAVGAGFADVPFDVTTVDPFGFTVVSGLFTSTLAGTFLVYASATAMTAGITDASIMVNGAQLPNPLTVGVSAAGTQALQGLVTLAVGDTLALNVNTTGVTLTSYACRITFSSLC